MTAAALVMSVLALGLAGIAYWRSGGERDVIRLRGALRRELGALRARQTELVDHASETVAAAYEASRARLGAARTRAHRLQEAAIEGLDVQLRRVTEQLESLGRRLEHAAGDARDATVAAAWAAERGIASRVRRIQARVVILEVKAKATLADHAARERDFDRADRRLAQASDLLVEARTILGDDDIFNDELDAIRDALRHAVTAVQSQAEDTRRRIEQVLADADHVVAILEADERQAAGTDTPAAARR